MCLLFYVLNVCNLYDAFNRFWPNVSSFTLASMLGRLRAYSIDLLKEISIHISVFAEGVHRKINYRNLIKGLSFSQVPYIFSNLIYYQLSILDYLLEEVRLFLSGNDVGSRHSCLLFVMFICSMIPNQESTNVWIIQMLEARIKNLNSQDACGMCFLTRHRIGMVCSFSICLNIYTLTDLHIVYGYR
ncbi:hypothetical protein VPH35_031033 [Triticum aestivum]